MKRIDWVGTGEKRPRLLGSRFFLTIPAFLLFFSCATLKPGDIVEPGLRLEPEAPRAVLSRDIYLFRIDLDRKTLGNNENIRNINLDGTYKPIGDLVPYNYIGVYLGNGFFLDLNGNLSIDIIKLLGLEEYDAFRLKRIEAGTLDGGNVTIEEADSTGRKITARIEENRLEIDTSRFFAPMKLTWSEKEVRMHPVGLFSEFKKGSIRKQSDFFVYNTGFRVDQTGPEEILINNTHKLTRKGNEILYETKN